MMWWRDIWFERETGHLRCWWRVLAFLGVAAAATVIFSTLLAMPLQVMQGSLTEAPEPLQAVWMIIFSVGSILASLLTGVWALRTFEHLPPHTLGVSLHGSWLRTLLVSFVAGGGLVLLLGAALWASGAATLTVQPFTAAQWLALLPELALALAIAVTTVTFFHGYFFQTLLRGLGPLPALLIVGVLVAATFLLGTSQYSLIVPANLLVLAILLGMLYLRSGALWAPIGLFCGWNAVTLFIHFPTTRDITPATTPLSLTVHGAGWLSDPAFGPEGGVIASAVLLAALAVVAYTRRGLPLASRWWEWRAYHTAAREQTYAWDFSIGTRYYQWKLLAREHTDA